MNPDSRHSFIQVRFLCVTIVLCLSLLSCSSNPAKRVFSFRQLTDDTFEPGRPAWSPDGKRIATQSNRFGISQIVLIDVRSGDSELLTTEPYPCSAPSWSPDGGRIAFSCAIPESLCTVIVVQNLSNASRIILGRGGKPDWAPNGDSILVETMSISGPGTSCNRVGLGIIEPIGSMIKAVAVLGEYSPTNPKWSPRGNLISFIGQKQATSTVKTNLSIVSTNGGEPIVVWPEHVGPGTQCWSPDGSWIAFEFERTEVQSEFVQGIAGLKLDDGTFVEIVDGKHGAGFNPAWSPDGRHLAFVSYSSGRPSIWIAENVDRILGS